MRLKACRRLCQKLAVINVFSEKHKPAAKAAGADPSTALRKWGGAHQTSNHLPKPHI